MESQNNEKEKILDSIFLKKEDTLKQLEKIVNLSQRDFSIELDTKNVIFKNHIKTIPDLITRLLIAVFLMKEKNLVETDSVNISEIGRRLSIPRTSLSKPLGNLIKKGLIKKDDKGNYSVIYYKIINILEGEKNA